MNRLDLETNIVGYSLLEPRNYAEALTLGVTLNHFSDGPLRALWGLIGASVSDDIIIKEIMKVEGGFERFNQVTNVRFYESSQPVALVTRYAKDLIALCERGWILDQMRQMENLLAQNTDTHAVAQIANGIAARIFEKQTKKPITRYAVGQKYLQDKAQGKRRPLPLAFGIDIQDQFLSNVLPGEFIMVAARAGEGKTAWALQFAQQSAKRGTSILFITGEMQDVELFCRMASQETGVDGRTLRQADLPDHVRESVERENAKWENVPLTIEPMGSSRTGDDIVNSIKRAFLSGVQVVILDYVGLIGGGKFRSRHEEMADISRRLKLIASDTGGVVVALAQLNRNAVAGKKEGDLNLSHLAESDQFGRDSELVFMLSQKDDGSGHTTVFVAKNRHGERGKFAMQFSGKLTRFIGEVPLTTNQNNNEDIFF